MPNKTTQILKELEQTLDSELGKKVYQELLNFNVELGWSMGDLVVIVTNMLKAQQQEDYQEVLDLELMKDEEVAQVLDRGVIKFDNEKNARNWLRKELRNAIAEKRGKV